MRITGVIAALIGAVLALAGCAPPSTGAAGSAATATTPLEWMTMAGIVTGVRPGPHPTTVLIDMQVPAGQDTCARNPRAEIFDEEANTVFVHAIFDSLTDLVRGACPSMVDTVVTLTAPHAIDTRDLTVNEQAAWTPAGSTYRTCPAEIGCHPPADHCAANWANAAASGTDSPAHSARVIEHCDQQWLILTLDGNGAACGAGGRPGCSAPPHVIRHFFRFDNGWREVATTTDGGCTAVQAHVPSFPPELCADLAPTQ